MKLKNILIVVKDIEASKKFYKDLFGLDLLLDREGNSILTEGLVLQDEKIWSSYIGKEAHHNNNSFELYFEERNIDEFVVKLENLYPNIEYIHKLNILEWEQKMVMFYDLDGNIIEVRDIQ